MNNRSAPLRRTGFKSRSLASMPTADRDEELSRRAARMLAHAAPRTATMAGSCTGVQVLKEPPLRSERYRRAVASLPCAYCGIEGYSQLIDRVSAFAATELGVTFPASFQQWEGMQVDTGEIIGGVYE